METGKTGSAGHFSRSGKYLKYAIGEVVLVVIGILIALSINNWNQNRIEANEELNILKALKVGLETDLVDLNYNANSISASIASANSAINSLENNDPYKDSIADHLGIMMLPVKFLYSTSAFETLKSKGIDLIKNQQVRDAIVGVYDSNYNFFLGFEQNMILDENERGLKFVFPTLFEESYVANLSKANFEPRLVPLDYETLKQHQEFLYYIKSYRNRLKIFLNFHYKGRLLIRVQDLINVLEAEIKYLEH
jgi:hypothetical protein